MTHDFLLELGIEEMPAHLVTPSINQLADKIEKYLKNNRLSYKEIKKYSTPRRLAVQVIGLADRQPDIDEEVKGPSEKIAKDKDGNWSRAAIGFSKGQGMSPDDIGFKDLKGEKYAFINKHVTGKSAFDILQGLPDVIKTMKFPTEMKWGKHQLAFIRPIRWMVALLDDQVVPMSLVDVKSGRRTQGHRFLGKPCDIKNADDYANDLEHEKVMADAQKRKALIKEQIEKIAHDNDWLVDIDPGLLEEVNNIVEWPTAFSGSFADKYLQIPKEVLITSMKDNQRFFAVSDKDGKLLPHFISVRNGNSDYLNNVISGNEKVLAARLADAAFFYDEDQRKTIADDVDALKKVSFHDKISSVYEKMERVTIIARQLGRKVGLNDSELEDLKRATSIYKFDLVTGMVDEFAELQGTMASKYAALAGEKPDVVSALAEQYLPNSADGELPQTKLGALLATADKLDTLMTFFGAEMIPSGSNDPYALRREAYGIVRIINNEGWNFALEPLMENAIAEEDKKGKLPKVDQKPQLKKIIEFIDERIKRFLKSKKVRFDLTNAAVDANNSKVNYKIKAAHVLDENKDNEQFKPDIEALDRVVRIAKKGKFEPGELTVDSDLFENGSEKELHAKNEKLRKEFAKMNPEAAFSALTDLKPAIDNYFDDTMVISKDEEKKDNHLKELTNLSRLISQFADVDEIVVK